jgi:hypothetical protein
MNQTSKYKSSFTSGDLLQEEIMSILKEVSFENILTDDFDKSSIQLKTKSPKSKKRILYEATRRIRAIRDERVWHFFLDTNDQNRKLILFYSILMVYDLLLDFMLDVVHEKWMNLQTNLTREDFFEFVEIKARNIPELKNKSERSVSDMSYSMFKAMREVGMLKGNTLEPVTIDDSLKKLFNSMGEGWFIEILPKK